MAQHRSHRRPRPSQFDDELRDDRELYDDYNERDTYPPYDRGQPRHHSPHQSPPRRHKSERRRPPPDQDRYPEDPYSDPRQSESYQRRHEPDRRGQSEGPGRRRRDLSPPPVGPDVGSRRHKSKTQRSSRAPSLDSEPRGGRKSRPEQRSRKPDSQARPQMPEDYNDDPRMAAMYGRDTRSRDPYGDPYGRKPPRDYPEYSDDAHERKYKHRDPYGDSAGRHRRGARDAPPELRQRGRTQHSSDSDDNYYGGGRRQRARSQERDQRRDPRGRPRGGRSPSRGRPPTTQKTRGEQPRRSSMPATTKGKTTWWQNPYVQAGCRTAFTAGAQAAMKSRNDPAPWMGAKGAKVATAALGAALVDGWIGQKHPGSARQNIARQGVDLASAQVAAGGIPHHPKSRHRR